MSSFLERLSSATLATLVSVLARWRSVAGVALFLLGTFGVVAMVPYLGRTDLALLVALAIIFSVFTALCGLALTALGSRVRRASEVQHRIVQFLARTIRDDGLRG